MPKESPQLVKTKLVFKDTNTAYRLRRRLHYARLLADCGLYLLARAAHRTPHGPRLFQPHPLDARFFGMNICPSPHPAGDDIQIQALRDLHVASVRVDYPEDSDRAPADRLIDRLAAEGFPVVLHLVQHPHQAAAMANRRSEAAKNWRRFVEEALERHGAHIEALEPGSTPNRHSWSGYTPGDYAVAAAHAHQALEDWRQRSGDRARPRLIGPNISDFAPYFNIGQLAACRRRGVVFDVMTDNLFVDRVGEPEESDPHIAGRALCRLHRLNLPRKQRFLAHLGECYGAPQSWGTYMHYTLNIGRKGRRHVSRDQYAAYMARAHLLTAAGGAFRRLYWGTLVSCQKGLIDEGVRIRPYPPFVHHRFAIDGPPKGWSRREDLISVYATFADLLADAHFVDVHSLTRSDSAPSPFVFQFDNPTRGETILAVWTRDGHETTIPVQALSETVGKERPRQVLDIRGREQGLSAGRISAGSAPAYLVY